MTPARQLEKLQKKKHELRQTFSRLDNGLASGKISLDEYRYYINKVFSGKQEYEVLRSLEMQEEQLRSSITQTRSQTSYLVPVIAVVAVLGLLSLFVLPGDGGITGFVVGDVTGDGVLNVSGIYSQSESIVLDINSTQDLLISGLVRDGSANVTLIVGEREYLVYSTLEPEYVFSSAYESYALGDIIELQLKADVSHTTWLVLPDGNRVVLGDDIYIASVAGVYSADALVNDSGEVTIATTSFIVREDNDSSNNVIREKVDEFDRVCEETCDLAIVNETLVLDISLSQGAVLELSEVVATVARQNSAPIQDMPIPSISVGVGESVEMDLSQYFSDSDGDELYYDYMSVPGVELSVEGSSLTITGLSIGEEQTLIYASDLYELVQSNSFTITVTEANISDYPTSEENSTEEPSNQVVVNESVVNNTVEETLVGDVVLDCSADNPNDRPLGCVQAVEQFANPQPIYLEDLDRRIAAKITPIGNLLLTGEVVEGATGSPGSRDFRVSTRGTLGVANPIAWISEGNLYLEGRVFEEELDINPPSGAYSIQNSQSVTVAYFDRENGDLHIRGNVIAYRRELQ